MAFLGMRKWSTPVIRPMWPFLIGGSVVAYAVYSLQEKGVRSEEWRNDARNPYAAQIAKESLH
ncbi:ATPase, F0 complex, subunit J [Amanita rubescens]|nr:ATPase, F0 complex, subunit J [Amanita rubescens]KAF8343341.1 ATPase, F0 complex, subunit J [Amanita rubescens]